MVASEPEDSVYPAGSHRLTETWVHDRYMGGIQDMDPRDEYGRDFDETPVQSVVAYGLAAISSAEYWRAVHALRRRGTREVFDAMARLAGGSSTRGRRLAADVLAQLGAKEGEYPYADEAIPYLLPLLDDPDEEVQAAVGFAFGNHASDEAVPGLLRLSRSENPDVRLGSVFGLHTNLPYWEIDECRFHPEAVEALVRLGRDPAREVRDWAVFQLAMCDHYGIRDDSIVEVLSEQARADDNEIRVEAINGLAKWEPERALPLLQEELERELKEGDYWRDAFEAAEQLAHPSLIPLLEQILQDMHEEPGEFEEHWTGSVRDAIAACSGLQGSDDG